MKRFFRIVFLFAIFLTTIGILSACDSCQNNPDANKSSLSLDYTLVVLNRYETCTLEATKKNLDGDVIWLSSDETKATVSNDGRVKAYNEGVVTISAVVGGITATCQVIIITDGVLPQIEFEDVNTTVKVGDSFSVEPTLVYENKKFNAIYTFASQNEEVLTVSKNGKVTAVGVGKTTVSVTTKLYGYTTTSFVEFTVKPNVIISSSSTDLLLGVSEVNGYVVNEEVTLSVILNGNVVEKPRIVWTSQDDQVATVNEGIITAVGVGTTVIDATFISYGEQFVHSISVTVEMPVIKSEVEFEPIDCNADDGDTITLNFYDVIDTSLKTANIIKIYDGLDGSEIPFTANGDDIVINKSDVTVGEKTFILEWAKISYEVNFILATKIVSNADELVNMYKYLTLVTGEAGVAGSIYDGYIILDADIDASGINMSFGNWSNGWYNTFAGTFDGQNHIIYNLDETNSNGGIFASTTVDAVIKNLRFYNATMSGNGGYVVTGFAGKAENIFVSGKILGGGENWAVTSLLFCKSNGSVSLKNIAIVLEDNLLSDESYAGIVFGEANTNMTFENIITVQIAGTPTPNYNMGRVKLSDSQNYESDTVQSFATVNDYVAWLNDDSDKEWATFAKKEIANYIKESIMPIADVYSITVGESKDVTNDTTWLSESKLVEKIDGISYAFDKTTGVGTVTVADTVTRGTTFTIQNTAKDGTVATATFNVLAKNKYTLDAIGDVEINGGDSTFAIDLRGYASYGVSDVWFNGESIPTDAWKVQDDNVIITKNKIKSLYGDGVISVISEPKDNNDENKRITINADVTLISKIINNVDDLNNMKLYSAYIDTYSWELWGGKFTEDVWYGHYILGANLELGEANIVSKNNDPSGRIWEEGRAGFYGTFDGRGHYINGGVYGTGGILGHGNKEAVVKDVAFIGVTLGEHAWSNVIAVSFWGTLENVLVTIKADNRKDGEGGALIVNGAGSFTAKNVIVYDKGGRTKENAGRLSSYVNHQYYGKTTNVYVFTNYYVAQEKYENNCHIEPIALGTTLDGAGVDKTAFDSTIWNMSGDEAKFVSMR